MAGRNPEGWETTGHCAAGRCHSGRACAGGRHRTWRSRPNPRPVRRAQL